MPTTLFFRNEAALQAHCIAYAENRGVVAGAWKKSNKTGRPDVIFAFDGNDVVFVEFKHPNGRGVLSENQKERIRELRSKGCTVYVCHTLRHFEQIIAVHLDRGSESGHRSPLQL